MRRVRAQHKAGVVTRTPEQDKSAERTDAVLSLFDRQSALTKTVKVRAPHTPWNPHGQNPPRLFPSV